MLNIGVVIPAYNVADYLADAIRSISRQTHQRWHCVVVDDDSPDGALDIANGVAADDPRVKVLHTDNAGPAVARNRGVAVLPPVDAYLFLDGDDVLNPDALSLLGNALERYPGAGGVFGRVRLIDAHDSVLGFWGAEIGGDSLFTLADVAEANPCPAPGGYLFRAETFEAAGGWDSSLHYCEDWLLTCKVARRRPLVRIPNVVLDYRRHATSMTSTDSTGHDQIRRLRSVLYADPGCTAADRSQLRVAWRRHNISKAREASSHRAAVRALTHIALACYGRPIDLSGHDSALKLMRRLDAFHRTKPTSGLCPHR